MQLHDLTLPSTDTPKNLQCFVGLGMQFILIPRTNYSNIQQTLDHFRKDLFTKTFFDGRPLETEEVFNPKLHVPTDWKPKFWDLPSEIINRYEAFTKTVRSNFRKKRRHTNNLLPHQKLSMKKLTLRNNLLIVNSDKNVDLS